MVNLTVLFEEEKRTAADRENRLTRKIEDLHAQVNDLQSALREEKLANEAREQRLTKQLINLNSRLLSSQSSSTKNNQPCYAKDSLESNQKHT